MEKFPLSRTLPRPYAVSMATILGYETAATCWITGLFDDACVPIRCFPTDSMLGCTTVTPISSLLAADRANVSYRIALSFGNANEKTPANNEPWDPGISATEERPYHLLQALIEPAEAFKLSTGRRDRLLKLLESMPQIAPDDRIHFMAPASTSRSRLKGAAVHVCSNALPPGSLVRLLEHDDLFAVSPELAFLQMATKLDEVKLAQFGCELCSTFFYDPAQAGGLAFRQLALTSTSQLTSFLEQCGDGTQARLARKAAARVIDSAHSPMEIVLALLFSLPCRLGGYGLPRPMLNYPVNMKSSRLGKPTTRFVDLCWPDCSLAVEYYGKDAHEGDDQAVADVFRQNDFATTGWMSLVVTREHFALMERLDSLAEEAARRMGHRLRKDRLLPLRDRRKLVSSLMRGPSLIPPCA